MLTRVKAAKVARDVVMRISVRDNLLVVTLKPYIIRKINKFKYMTVIIRNISFLIIFVMLIETPNTYFMFLC